MAVFDESIIGLDFNLCKLLCEGLSGTWTTGTDAHIFISFCSWFGQ